MTRVKQDNNYFYQCNKCHTTIGKIDSNDKDNNDTTHNSVESSSDSR